MGDLIDLRVRQDTLDVEKNDGVSPENHLHGPAKCLACGHEWVAEEIPTGTDIFDLVCPSCDMRRGQLQYAPVLGDDMLTWIHKCGSSHYTPTYVGPDGYVKTVEELALLNTAGKKVAELKFFCDGCGELIDPETMW